jgi:hypothetical protein
MPIKRMHGNVVVLADLIDDAWFIYFVSLSSSGDGRVDFLNG